MISRVTEIKRVVLVRINPGDDVLAGMREAVQEHGIRNGLILTGFGSVTDSHFHVVVTGDLPPENGYPRSSQPLDVCSLNGYVMDGRVHCHIEFSDERNGFGGHLEEGCTALTFVNVAIGELADVKISDWDTFSDEAEL